MVEEILTWSSIFGKFELLQNAIRYRGSTYPISSVVHLGRYAKRTSVNFIPMMDFLRIRIYIDKLEKPITIQNSIGLLFTTSTLKKIYAQLVEKTFGARIEAYLNEIRNEGFFEYDKAKFFPSGEVSIGRKKINLHSTKLWIEPFSLILRESTAIFARKYRISMDIDRDVFLALLKGLYGIQFDE